MSAPHLAAQAALVRMLYDPVFAARVREDPDAVLPTLPAALRQQLAAVDPRALRRDAHRRERTLGQLCSELPCATTLALAERRTMDVLLGFYESAQFHEAIETGQALVLALATYLEALLATGALRSPHIGAVLALELASARARRAGTGPEQPQRAIEVDAQPAQTLRRARGVEVLEVATGALATLRAVEDHRFRLALLPGWALVADPPALSLPELGPARQGLCAIYPDGSVSLVEIETPLFAVLTSLPHARRRSAIVDEAAMRLGGDRDAAEAALVALVADELVVTS